MNNLKEVRVKRGMTQVQVAVQVGVSLGAYRLWESGAGKPIAENLVLLVAVLGDDISI